MSLSSKILNYLTEGFILVHGLNKGNLKMELTFENIFKVAPFIVLIIMTLFTIMPVPMGLIVLILLAKLLYPSDIDAPP